MNIATIVIALLLTVVVEASFFLSPKSPGDCDRAGGKLREALAGTKSIERCTEMAVNIGWYCRGADAKGLVGLWRLCVGPDPSTKVDDTKASLEMLTRVSESRRLDTAKPETSPPAVPPIAAPQDAPASPVQPIETEVRPWASGGGSPPIAAPQGAPVPSDWWKPLRERPAPSDWEKGISIFGGG